MALVKIDPVPTNENIKAHIVDDRSQADLNVYISDLRGISHGKDAVWTYIEAEAEADLRVYWQKNIGNSLKICLVDDIAVSGWNNKDHKLYKQLL